MHGLSSISTADSAFIGFFKKFLSHFSLLWVFFSLLWREQDFHSLPLVVKWKTSLNSNEHFHRGWLICRQGSQLEIVLMVCTAGQAEERQARSGPDNIRAKLSSMVAAGRGRGRASFSPGTLRVETKEIKSLKQVKLSIRARWDCLWYAECRATLETSDKRSKESVQLPKTGCS